MTNKNIVLTVLVVALFVGSGVVLYSGLFSQTEVITGVAPDIASAQKDIVEVLPFGESLDFSKVKTRAGSPETFSIKYQTLNPAEVGVNKRELVSPIFGSPSTSPLNSPETGGNPSPARTQRTGG